MIISQNHKFQNNLYKDTKTVLLLEKIISEFSSFCRKNNKKPVLIVIPQKQDLKDFKNKKIINDNIFFSFSHILPIIDLMPLFFKNENKFNLYESGDLGDHTSNEMNCQIAEYIYKFLKKKSYL